MTLRHENGIFGHFIRQIHEYEQTKYAPLATPSTANLVRIFNDLRRKKAEVYYINGYGDIIDIEQIECRHFYTDGPSYSTNGVRVAVRQKLPEDKVGGVKYLSTIMRRDGKGEINLSTCVVIPTTSEIDKEQYGDFKRIGDLRSDYVSPKGKFREFDVDGNDDAYGIQTGKWGIRGSAFEGALTRAYLLIVNRLYNVGSVHPINSPPQASGLMLSSPTVQTRL